MLWLIIMASVVLAFMAALFAWLERSRAYHDPRWEAVHAEFLPTGVRDHLDEHTGEFRSLGFQPLGDFTLKIDSMTSYARHFLSHDGLMHGSISWCYSGPFNVGAIKSVGYTVLFEDGGLLIVSDTGGDALANATFPLIVLSLPKTSATGLYDVARAKITERDALDNVTAVPIPPDQWQAVETYGFRLVAWHLHHTTGAKDVPQPAPYPGLAVATAE